MKKQGSSIRRTEKGANAIFPSSKRGLTPPKEEDEICDLWSLIRVDSSLFSAFLDPELLGRTGRTGFSHCSKTTIGNSNDDKNLTNLANLTVTV